MARAERRAAAGVRRPSQEEACTRRGRVSTGAAAAALMLEGQVRVDRVAGRAEAARESMDVGWLVARARSLVGGRKKQKDEKQFLSLLKAKWHETRRRARLAAAAALAPASAGRPAAARPPAGPSSPLAPPARPMPMKPAPARTRRRTSRARPAGLTCVFFFVGRASMRRLVLRMRWAADTRAAAPKPPLAHLACTLTHTLSLYLPPHTLSPPVHRGLRLPHARQFRGRGNRRGRSLQLRGRGPVRRLVRRAGRGRWR